jgi:hypothetical protein
MKHLIIPLLLVLLLSRRGGSLFAAGCTDNPAISSKHAA